MAVPNDYLFRFNIGTDLDEQYIDATLKVWIGMIFTSNAQNARVNMSLKDAGGKSVPLNPGTIQLSREKPEVIADIPVTNPIKWDAEHPNLYTLEAKLVVNGTTVETITKNVGFRKVKIDGRKLLVNGEEVKLRGSGQFDCDPLDGHALPDTRVIPDVMLYKQTNHNFIRPACYPPTEAFLDACDRIGMYIECEMPVTFAAAASNKELTPIFLSQCSEAIENNRSHPCVIMWDLANETSYGINIKKMETVA
jgi:beta-galactosidase/beta-glucuronidase